MLVLIYDKTLVMYYYNNNEVFIQNLGVGYMNSYFWLSAHNIMKAEIYWGYEERGQGDR